MTIQVDENAKRERNLYLLGSFVLNATIWTDVSFLIFVCNRCFSLRISNVQGEKGRRVRSRNIIYIYIYIYIYIIFIIIIMSCRQHGYPWPSLATFPYRSSPPAGLLGYILCPHIAAVCKFGLVVLLLLGHMWGSIVVRHLRARPCFSSSVRRVWLVWPV